MTILREVDSGKDHFISLPCLIGRGEEADLVLADHTVSHRHALIDSSDDRLWIKDLDSVNGVWLNGERISGKTFLHPGDFIQLGQSKFLLPVAEEEKSEQTIILHALDRTSVAHEMDRRRLDLIYSITAEFPSSQDIIHIGEKIFAGFKDFFHQDHGTIALLQEDGDLRTLCCDSRMEPVPFSRSIVNRVLQNGESLLLEDALGSDLFKEEESVIALRIRSAMCAPLIYHNRINGLIYLDRNISGAYSQSDLELFQSIGYIIAPLIENARLWSELKKKYSNTVDKLRKTETRLIDTERVAAYVRLSQAMAHEVRNPLVILGGLIRGIGRSEQTSMGKQKCQAILQS
ncbi:MAG: FHA domain-containing protein, partial [Desulfobulbaceae bacterium]|nr:FHA domain-containing protein [Desulfobulbaceae bacterium]